MDNIFIVPGIMGSELYLNGEKLWPPKITSNVKNPDRLLDPAVLPGDIIRNVFVVSFYDKLLKPLEKWGYREEVAGTKGLVSVWPYNWVRGVPENAKMLARGIRAAIAKHPEMDIVLLAHSMGGLICTYALECLSESDPSWRDRVRLMVTFGTPFWGAPESLKNAFGVEGVKGITARDCHRLMAEPQFPSAYQLFPHLSVLPAWASEPPLDPLTSYQELDPSGPVLGIENLAAARTFQLQMQGAKPNPRTRKFNFCGSTYKTVWSVGATPDPRDTINPFESKSGDGTVPSWSGRQDVETQFAPLGAKHSSTFEDRDLLDVLRDLLAKPTPPSGSPPGIGLRIGRTPAPGPAPQPKVSVINNAISSRLSEVEIEVSEPPLDGLLRLAWMPLEHVETPEDLSLRVASAGGNVLQEQLSIPMGQDLDFPVRLSIPRPSAVGQFALAGWAGESERIIHDLAPDRLDVVWVFDDQHQDTTTGGVPAASLDETGEYIDRKPKKRDELNDQATNQMQYHEME